MVKETVNDVNSNVYIEVKIVTNGTLGMNDNMRISHVFKQMGFEYDGEGIMQEDGSGMYHSILKMDTFPEIENKNQK